jgi:hypothetical protein
MGFNNLFFEVTAGNKEKRFAKIDKTNFFQNFTRCFWV